MEHQPHRCAPPWGLVIRSPRLLTIPDGYWRRPAVEREVEEEEPATDEEAEEARRNSRSYPRGR
jgi:hypothetical protein